MGAQRHFAGCLTQSPCLAPQLSVNNLICWGLLRYRLRGSHRKLRSANYPFQQRDLYAYLLTELRTDGGPESWRSAHRQKYISQLTTMTLRQTQSVTTQTRHTRRFSHVARDNAETTRALTQPTCRRMQYGAITRALKLISCTRKLWDVASVKATCSIDDRTLKLRCI